MLTRRNQWRNANKRVFRFTDERLDKAYRQLFGMANKAGCVVCNEDTPDLLGIYPHDYHEKEWRILCEKCYFNFDNKLQKQIGGNHV